MPTPRRHSVMMRSAHSTSETKIAIAEFCTPLRKIGVSHSTGTEHAAHAQNLNLPRHNLLQCSSSGGQPTGTTALANDKRIRRDGFSEKEDLHGVAASARAMTVQNGKAAWWDPQTPTHSSS